MAVAAAATAASATLRRCFLPCPWLLLSFSPKPHVLFFSISSHSESFSIRVRALRPVRPPSDAKDSGNDDEGLKVSRGSFKKSRNESKREARRAVRWGMDLSTFTPPQIKQILSKASLGREVLDAILLAKRLSPDVREGKRRQFNYIGRLLRNAQPELMDALIRELKTGDASRLQGYSGLETGSIGDNDDVDEDLESIEQEGKNYVEVAEKWLDGLIYKDTLITNEVYSVQSVDFDRQELRKLVRQVQSVLNGSHTDESGLKGDVRLTKAKKPLLRFLHSLAKKLLAGKKDLV